MGFDYQSEHASLINAADFDDKNNIFISGCWESEIRFSRIDFKMLEPKPNKLGSQKLELIDHSK